MSKHTERCCPSWWSRQLRTDYSDEGLGSLGRLRVDDITHTEEYGADILCVDGCRVVFGAEVTGASDDVARGAVNPQHAQHGWIVLE